MLYRGINADEFPTTKSKKRRDEFCLYSRLRCSMTHQSLQTWGIDQRRNSLRLQQCHQTLGGFGSLSPSVTFLPFRCVQILDRVHISLTKVKHTYKTHPPIWRQPHTVNQRLNDKVRTNARVVDLNIVYHTGREKHPEHHPIAGNCPPTLTGADKLLKSEFGKL